MSSIVDRLRQARLEADEREAGDKARSAMRDYDATLQAAKQHKATCEECPKHTPRCPEMDHLISAFGEAAMKALHANDDWCEAHERAFP